jgi:hypothetical protein
MLTEGMERKMYNALTNLSRPVQRNLLLHKGHFEISKYCGGHKPVVNEKALFLSKSLFSI